MNILKIAFLTVGLLSLGLGALGIFLPILPTTPFFLLAAFCFAKSSPRFLRWFSGTKLYKKHLEGYAKNRAMTLKTKLSILIPVSLMLIVTALLIDIFLIKIFLIFLLLLKCWYFIFIIGTIKPIGE